MPANTRPDWMDAPEITQVEDPQLIASIEAAMKSRGIDPPANGQRAEGVTSAPSTNSLAPGIALNGGVDGTKAGFFAREDAPAAEGEGAGGVGTDATGTPPNEQTQTQTQAPATTTTTDPAADDTPRFTVHLDGGQEWQPDEDQIKYLLGVNSWTQNQPDTVKQQWGQIEQGTHRAVPLADAQAYDAWVASGRPNTQAPAPAAPARPDLSLVESDIASYIQTLESKVQTQQPVQQTQQPVVQQPAPGMDASAQAAVLAQRQIATQQHLDTARGNMATKYGLDEPTAQYLERAAAGMNLVGSIAESHRRYAPTGTLISEAPMQQVFEEAMELAMSRDSKLRTFYEDNIVQQSLARNGDTLNRVAQKKANAGSLATAPSAAVPGTQMDPRKMTHNERQAAMTQELAEAMRNTGN